MNCWPQPMDMIHWRCFRLIHNTSLQPPQQTTNEIFSWSKFQQARMGVSDSFLMLSNNASRSETEEDLTITKWESDTFSFQEDFLWDICSLHRFSSTCCSWFCWSMYINESQSENHNCHKMKNWTHPLLDHEISNSLLTEQVSLRGVFLLLGNSQILLD